jgi:DNA-directed RNA polymerase subunit RPC12/RpoP
MASIRTYFPNAKVFLAPIKCPRCEGGAYVIRRTPDPRNVAADELRIYECAVCGYVIEKTVRT